MYLRIFDSQQNVIREPSAGDIHVLGSQHIDVTGPLRRVPGDSGCDVLSASAQLSGSVAFIDATVGSCDLATRLKLLKAAGATGALIAGNYGTSR